MIKNPVLKRTLSTFEKEPALPVIDIIYNLRISGELMARKCMINLQEIINLCQGHYCQATCAQLIFINFVFGKHCSTVLQPGKRKEFGILRTAEGLSLHLILRCQEGLDSSAQSTEVVDSLNYLLN